MGTAGRTEVFEAERPRLLRLAAGVLADRAEAGDRRTGGREPTMKTMTCRQLGGPCELGHRGETADDVIAAQDRHLREAVRAGSADHQEARDAMRGRWRHPKQSLGWYRDMQQAFADLPED